MRPATNGSFTQLRGMATPSSVVVRSSVPPSSLSLASSIRRRRRQLHEESWPFKFGGAGADGRTVGRTTTMLA